MVTLKSLDDQILIEISEGQNLLLGRLMKCDVVLEDSSISSQHARLKLQDNLLRVTDVGSTNGTRLNYSLLSAPAYLQDGDTIEFGNVTFVVDGPQLTVPQARDLAAQTLTSLELIEASQKLEDTMIAMDLSQEELEAASRAEPSPVETASSLTDPQHDQPVLWAFLLALVLIATGGFLLLVYLWPLPPQV